MHEPCPTDCLLTAAEVACFLSGRAQTVSKVPSFRVEQHHCVVDRQAGATVLCWCHAGLVYAYAGMLLGSSSLAHKRYHELIRSGATALM
jgi:hypothetical protein